MMKRWFLVAVCALLLPSLAFGYTSEDIARTHTEGSMVVTGLIAVNPDGSVYGYSLDHRNKLPAEIVNLINGTLSGWKFTPVKVKGKPVLAKARMSLRIVARQTRPKHFVASVVGAQFGIDAKQSEVTPSDNACASDYICIKNDNSTSYLRGIDVSGIVYVVLEVDRQGRVAKSAVRQVDLRAIASKAQLDVWRRKLANDTLRAARGWAFTVPTTGVEANRNDWVVMVPVNYELREAGMPPAPGYGQWDAYIPGPVNSIPWADAQSTQLASKGSADAIPDNSQPFLADPRFVLLTPLGGGTDKASGASSGQG